MKTIEYTSEIIKEIKNGSNLTAIKYARDTYGLSLPEAKKMIEAYKPGITTFTSSELSDDSIHDEVIPQQEKQQEKRLLAYCCPNCGSEQIHKSIGGKAEHVAAWGATKFIKSALLGDYGGLTGGVENEIIKENVPFQQVCDYCHRTFHSSKSDIDSGKYSLSSTEANRRMGIYNTKLQAIKDQEIEEIRDRAASELRNTIIFVFVFLGGLLVCTNCEHYTEGFLGIQSFTWSFMFSWVLMAIGGVGTFIAGSTSASTYNEASELENSPIEDYARNHKA